MKFNDDKNESRQLERVAGPSHELELEVSLGPEWPGWAM